MTSGAASARGLRTHVNDSILDLDATAAMDPTVAGAKAAWLARARRAGLPVLPGIVIPAPVSIPTMQLGLSALRERGPGGARLTMAQHPLPIAVSHALEEGVRSLGIPVIVRSSSLLEDNGEWAGAFESFTATHVDDVEPAVRSCWASAFTHSTLMRAEAAGIPPGSVPMAILIQPFVTARYGGVARTVRGGVEILVAEGSSALLLDGKVDDRGAESSLDASTRRRLVELLERASDELGITAFDWALSDDDVVLFQLTRAIRRIAPHSEPTADVDHPMAVRVSQVLRRTPGALGRQFVLPWSMGMAPELIDELARAATADVGPLKAIDRADELARSLTAEVWNRARPIAWSEAMKTMAALAEPDPRPALDAIAGLRTPDLEAASEVMALVGRVRQALTALRPGLPPSEVWHIDISAAVDILSGTPVELPTRVDMYDQFDSAVISHIGRRADGVPASPGRRSGRAFVVADPTDLSAYRPRDVVVASEPDRDLAPLLWTASGLVTAAGSPVAHLFEVARARNIPAVTNIDIDTLGHGDRLEHALCVDGFNGSVFSTGW